MQKTKILLTGSRGMLAYDFIRTQWAKFEIIGLDKDDLDITKIGEIEAKVCEIQPDIILNCAAYTNVDEAEDTGKKANFDINALGVFNLASIANKYSADFITLSSDYVFDGTKKDGYDEEDIPNPVNSYGLAKYLGEKLAQEVHPRSIIIRTSWLYGGHPYRFGVLPKIPVFSPLSSGSEIRRGGREVGGEGSMDEKKVFKNFVNTILKLSETRKELQVINDQFGSPTYTGDLSEALGEIIGNISDFRGKILHLSNETPPGGITWFDFASEIFKIAEKEIKVTPCTTEEYKTKAIRPRFSKMRNGSGVVLGDWKEGLREYLNKL